MNEKEQNFTFDYWFNKCPMFNNYDSIEHNKIIKVNKSTTLTDLDDIVNYPSYMIFGENKCNDNHGCHKKMEVQIDRMFKKKKFMAYKLGRPNTPAYFIYVHFENNEIHIEYMGMKK